MTRPRNTIAAATVSRPEGKPTFRTQFQVGSVAVLVIFVTMVWVSTERAVAAPEPFSISFDESLAYEGGGSYGQPGFNGVNDVMPSDPTVRVRLSGEIDDGLISAEAEDLVVEPGSQAIVPFESYYEDDWRAVGPVSGTFHAETGAMALNLNLEQTVTFETARCMVGPVSVTLSTEIEGKAGSGVRFVDGVNGPGALAGNWETVPEPVGSDCDLRELGCPARQSLLKGPGALGLARGGIELGGTEPRNDDPTKDKFGIVGYEDEGGCLGKRPDPGPGFGPPPDPELSVDLLHVFVRQRKVIFKVRGTNAGGPAADVKLCAKAIRGPRLRTRRCARVESLSSGSSFTRKLTVALSSNRQKRRRQLRRGRWSVTLTAEGQERSTISLGIRGPAPKR